MSADPRREPPAGLCEGLADGRLKCLACQRGCALGEGQLGLCRVRRHEAGRIVPLSYGRVAALHLANVERKPLFHFHPGRVMLSVGGLGCNCRCPGCQNRALSFAEVPDALEGVEFVPPRKLVEQALRQGLLGISFTYNEPAIWFEYTFETARLAREQGLLTNYVTNGSLTPEALDEIGRYLDAYRVDLKGFSEETYRRVCGFAEFRGVFRGAERARHRWGMHVECVTNVIPTINDEPQELRGIARRIAGALGPDTPWHVTAFAPQGDFAHLPRTPIETLELAREIGLEEGLRFVYIGNVPGHPAQNTYCPRCGEIVIHRTGLVAAECRLEDGACPQCGYELPGRWD